MDGLLRVLGDEHERVRKEAAQALGLLGEVRALRWLQEMTSNANESPAVQEAARAAIERIRIRATEGAASSTAYA